MVVLISEGFSRAAGCEATPLFLCLKPPKKINREADFTEKKTPLQRD